MRRRAIILIASLLVLPCQALTLDELADIFDEMESAVTDISIEYEWYNQNELTEEDIHGAGLLVPVSRAACTFTTAKPFTELQAYSEKVDLSQGPGTTFTSDRRYTYDGTLFRQLRSDGVKGFVTRRTDLLHSWNLTPMAFTIFRFYPQGLLSQGLRELPERFRLVDGIQQIRDFRTIELDSVLDTGQVYQKMFLAVDHGYAPVRFEYISVSDNSVNFEVEVLALQQVADGFWFPFKGTMGSPKEDDGSVFEVKRVTLNQHLSKDDFNLAFPPGIEVNDETAWWPKLNLNLAILSPGELAGVLLLLVVVAALVVYRSVRRRSPS